MKKKLLKTLIILVALFAGVEIAPYAIDEFGSSTNSANSSELASLEYDGEVAIEVNNNEPDFTEEEIATAKEAYNGYENYSELDSLGRCGVAEACVCEETRPSYGEKRGDISRVHPSGWQKINFWSRCHLIAWQFSAENDNEKNLITGTSYLNLSGMVPYENIIAEYLNGYDDRHVLYRVEPIYKGSELVARGVEMQALSLEDDGEAVSYHVYIFNYQPGSIIDYSDGTVEDDPEHRTVVTLKDKTAKFTGDEIEIDEAEVKGSQGKVKYIYYYDEETHNKLDGPPTNRGTYYVRAVVSGDNWYPTAVSEVAELRII
jgi:DNA-entry nuclease